MPPAGGRAESRPMAPGRAAHELVRRAQRIALAGRTRLRLEFDQPIPQTQAAERLGLARAPEDLQPAVRGGQLERGPVDVRGQVLPAHEPVGIVADVVAVIGPQQAGGSKLRVVQRARRVPVVDDHRQPALQSSTEPPSPSRSLEPDLRHLALDELDPDARQRRRQVGRRWGAGDLR